MEVQLQEIIGKIRKEGLETAALQADALKQEAEKTAKAIIEKATQDAEAIKAKGKAEAQRFEESAKAAITQAARDLTLTVKKNLEQLFSRLASEAVKSSYSQSVIEDAIVTLVKSWATMPTGTTIQLDEKATKAMVDSIKGKLKDLGKQDIIVEASQGVKTGFRIQDGGAYFDFTAETVAKALASYVNPALASIIRGQD